jgi:hypothetical protein
MYIFVAVSATFGGILWWAIKSYLQSRKKEPNDQAKVATLETVGEGKGFENQDKVSCYANSAVQCLFSIHENLFNVLPYLRGPISKEIERLAFSSLEKTESTKQLRELLPSGFGFAEAACQCIAEFWDTLLNCVDKENVPIGVNLLSYRSPLSDIFHFKNRKYLVCDICQWSEIEDNQICGNLLYLAVPESNKCDIPFNGVFYPNAVGRNCPNGHSLTSHMIFTKTSPYLAVSLNRIESGSKNNVNIVNFDLDAINLEVADESNAIDCCYHDLLLSSVTYKAVAIAVHLNLLSVGHYFVYKRTPKGGWYRCNDSVVNKVDLKDINQIDSDLLPQMTFLVLEKC